MFYQGRTVLVTGGTGFVGTHFVEELLRRGARVRVPVHRRPLRVGLGEVETVAADLTLPADCFRVCQGVDFIVHAAGGVAPAAVTNALTPVNPLSIINLNLNVSMQMLEAAWSAGVGRFLLLGSSTVYPAVRHAVCEDEAWSAPPHPVYFGYGWMRRCLERMAEFVAMKSTLRIAMTRASAVYGPHDDFDPLKSHVIPALIRKAVARMDPLEVWGDGSEVRDFLYVTDLVQGGLLAIEKHATCDPINLGSGTGHSIADVVRILLRLTGRPDAEPAFDATKPTTIPFRMVDISKARALLGYEAKVPLEAGLAMTLRWFLDNPRWTGAEA